MTFQVLYFARLREQFQSAGEHITLPQAEPCVQDLLDHLISRGGIWAEALGAGRIYRVAVDQDMAHPHTPLVGAKEVAIFPPVTGG